MFWTIGLIAGVASSKSGFEYWMGTATGVSAVSTHL